jgi:DNA-binding MarR family transcriptional regulator
VTNPFDLSTFLPYQLAYISERVSQRLSVDYERSHGFTVSEWRVLVNLRSLGPASVRDIQVFTNLEKSRVSRAIVRLEAAGLVRKAASKEDARLISVALTKAGQKALDAVLPAATDVEDRLYKGLSASQKKAFQQVLQHFHSVLDQDPDARARFDLPHQNR